MAATISFAGSQLTNADSTTGWTALKLAGAGGGPSVAAADGSIEGSGAVTCTVSRQQVALYYDLGAANTLDFTSGGAEEGQMLYIWANFLAPALLNTRLNGGFGIFLESNTPGTSQYHLWYMDGSDTYDGGWRRWVLDPTKTESTSSGGAGSALNRAAIRYVGIFADVGTNVLRFDNMICDAIDVGTGLDVSGTGTTDDLIGDLLSWEATNRKGIVTSLNAADTAVGLRGQLNLGDATTGNSTLTDVDAKIFLDEPLYDATSGTPSVVPSVPTDFFKINVVGGTGTNTIQIGKKVGTGDTASGRNGWTVVGNASYDLAIDFDDGNVNSSLWYGCTFERVTGGLSWGTNTAHECIGNLFNACGQFDPVGGVEIRNCTFLNYSGTTAALLWNGSIDIKNCNFLQNADATNDPSAIQHTTTGTVNYSGFNFSGNDNDVYLSATTGTLTINATNGTPGVLIEKTAGTSVIDVVSSVSVNITGLQNPSEVRVFEQGTETEIPGTGSENVTTGSHTFSIGSGEAVDISVLSLGYQNKRFLNYSTLVDASFPASQVVDRQYENP